MTQLSTPVFATNDGTEVGTNAILPVPVFITNLDDLVEVAVGPAGPTGATGAAGAPGATGAAGTNGTNGSTGATGSTGAAGTNGATWRQGSGAPSNGTGVDGDFYFRTDTGDVYVRASGTYGIVSSLALNTLQTLAVPGLVTLGTSNADLTNWIQALAVGVHLIDCMIPIDRTVADGTVSLGVTFTGTCVVLLRLELPNTSSQSATFLLQNFAQVTQVGNQINGNRVVARLFGKVTVTVAGNFKLQGFKTGGSAFIEDGVMTARKIS